MKMTKHSAHKDKQVITVYALSILCSYVFVMFCLKMFWNWLCCVQL